MSLQSMRNPNLAVVNMHSFPEITGQALKDSHEREPEEGWDVESANEAAAAAGVRYLKHNMALQFGLRHVPTTRTMDNYELWRPEEVVELTYDRDTVIEVHDCPHPAGKGEYVSFGGTYQVKLLRIAAHLGIKSVVETLSPTLNNHATQCATIEFSRDDAGNPARRLTENVERLRGCMRAITLGDLPEVDPADFDYYRRGPEIHWDEAISLGIDRMGTLEPFDPLPAAIAERLGLQEGEYVVDNWNGKCSAPGEWFGGVFRRIPPPMEYLDIPTERAYALEFEYDFANA